MSAWKRMMLALGLVDEYEQDDEGSPRRAPGAGPSPAGQARPRQHPPTRAQMPPQAGSVRPGTQPGPAPPITRTGGVPTGGVGPRPGGGPRSGVVIRPGGSVQETTAARAIVIEAREIEDAKRIADSIRERVPVVVDLRSADPGMARRVVDFSSGLTYALDGALKKTAKGVVLVSPPRVELSSREVRRLAALGLYETDS